MARAGVLSRRDHSFGGAPPPEVLTAVGWFCVRSTLGRRAQCDFQDMERADALSEIDLQKVLVEYLTKLTQVLGSTSLLQRSASVLNFRSCMGLGHTGLQSLVAHPLRSSVTKSGLGTGVSH